MRRALIVLTTLGILTSLTGCGTDAEDAATASSPASGDVRLPPTQGVFDYQLGGTYDTVPAETGDLAPDVVVRDVTAQAPVDAYGICYINGFQTQPGEGDEWLDTRSELLLQDAATGAPVTDPDWPEEYILDPSTAEQREGILAVIGPLIDDCAGTGFAAVEIDNLDTWMRFDGIDAGGAQSLARTYVDRAHGAGLAVAQKNAAEIADIAHDELGFDFAIAEECAVFQECDQYAAAYGAHVLQIEYPDALAGAGLDFQDVCHDPDRAPLTILRDRNLVAKGHPDYVYERCE